MSHNRGYYGDEKYVAGDHLSPARTSEEDAADMHMSAGRYIATRFSSLKPPLTPLPNPIRVLRLLNKQQWLFFLVAFFGWTWDAFDVMTLHPNPNTY